MTISTPQPSIAWEDVEQALVDWATEATGLETVWAEEDGPQPDRPYVVLDWLVPPLSIGSDYFVDTVDEVDEVLERELQGVREATLTVRVDAASTRAGESAMYYCDLLINSLGDDNVIATHFAPNRMAPWGDDMPTRKLAPFEDGKALSRMAFDMRLGFSAGIGGTAQRVPYIKTVALTGSVSNGSDEHTSATAIGGATS